MTEKEQIVKEKAELTGLFDFKGLYSFAHVWLKENSYGVDEERYEEKAEGEKRKMEIEWRAAKRFTDYFKFEHKVKFEVKDMVEVEVEIDGQKKMMNKGKVKVEITSTLIMDPDSKWDASPFSRFWRDFYNKYIIPTRVNTARSVVGDDSRNLKEELKAFLDLTGRR